MSGVRDWANSRAAWAGASVLLALCLHVAPLGYAMLAARLSLPSLLELDLNSMNSYRERIIREMAARRAAQAQTAMSLHVGAVTLRQGRDTVARRVSRPHSEAEMKRIRAVQQFIMQQWNLLAPEEPGASLVSLSLLEDGSIGEFVLHRVRGNAEFQRFLLSFLDTLKVRYANQAGPGERLWIECEFAVSPAGAGKKS